jgi:uncharacterized protein
MTESKHFIDSETLLLDSYRLCRKIYKSGFRPDFIVGLWRGGSPVGIAIQDCLDYLGVKTDHISLRTSYRGMLEYPQSNSLDRIRVHGTQYLLEHMNSEDRLLLVDDVFASGYSVEAVIRRLQSKMRRNFPEDVRVAVPWYKPKENKTGRVPDFFLHETDQWLVFPYELNGLTEQEIARFKPEVAAIRSGAV